MNIPFYKYSGTGNDFIIIDDRANIFPSDDIGLIERMCDRHFGIGSDGLMLIRHHDMADFEMVFFNPDASKSLCGNGSRCAVHFAQEIGLIISSGKFFTTDGLHTYEMLDEKNIRISMTNVSSWNTVEGNKFIDTGSPHLIIKVDQLEGFNVAEEGRRWRKDPRFAEISGTNVNFVESLSQNEIKIRTYERGVERETLSCGTGVTAAALAYTNSELGHRQITVQTEGGTLIVDFDVTPDGFESVHLSGAVLKIFEGNFHA